MPQARPQHGSEQPHLGPRGEAAARKAVEVVGHGQHLGPLRETRIRGRGSEGGSQDLRYAGTSGTTELVMSAIPRKVRGLEADVTTSRLAQQCPVCNRFSWRRVSIVSEPEG